MRYWRMQLHPAKPEYAMKYTVESLAYGFIGLDFEMNPGDLISKNKHSLKSSEKVYLQFAKEMKVGDKVLIIVHNHPFALVTIAGKYNYQKKRTHELGVWFRHFRRINKSKTKYYADRVTNPKRWKAIPMTRAIDPLHERSTYSYQLISNWNK